MSANYDNPYELRHVTLNAEVERPDGDVLSVPAFYMGGSAENSRWQWRFTPRFSGSYGVRFVLEDRCGEVSTDWRDFEVQPSDRKGFVGLLPSSRHFFAHDSGELFRGVGENIANIRPWSDNNSKEALKAFANGDPYAYYFEKLREVGANLIRKWISLPGAATSSIEYLDWPGGPHWSPKTRKRFDPHPPGRFDQQRLSELDTMFESARQFDIYIVLCLHSGHNFQHGAWECHPFNKQNGGPCTTPQDFLTDPEARRLTRNKLRYLIARYGYSPYLHSWEFWNECNSACGASLEDMVDWHKHMCDFMRQEDPYGHLLTTSVSGSDDYEALWSLSGLDYNQVHTYDQHELATPVFHLVDFYSRKYGKPCVIGEFGVKNPTKRDQRWGHLHKGLWQSTFSPAPTTALNWFREQIDAQDQYCQFEPVARVNRELCAEDGSIEQLRLPPIALAEDGPLKKDFYPARGWTKGSWLNAEAFSASVRADGFVEKNQVPYQLKPAYQFIIQAKFAQDGTFTVYPRNVRDASASSELFMEVDGEVAGRFDIKASMASGDLKKRGEKIGYMLDTVFAVSVPSGKHRVALGLNRDAGYAAVDIFQYGLTGLGQPQNRCFWPHGLRKGSLTWLWFDRSRTNWKAVREQGGPPPATEPFSTEIPVPTPGEYMVTWIDTFTGKTLATRKKETSAAYLPITIPSTVWDMACRISKQV